MGTTAPGRPAVPKLTAPVWDKLKKEKQGIDFKQDQEEECEDSNGNVMSRKTYEDLRRQGLL